MTKNIVIRGNLRAHGEGRGRERGGVGGAETDRVVGESKSYLFTLDDKPKIERREIDIETDREMVGAGGQEDGQTETVKRTGVERGLKFRYLHHLS